MTQNKLVETPIKLGELYEKMLKERVRDYFPFFFKVTPSIFSDCVVKQYLFWRLYPFLKDRQVEDLIGQGFMNDGEEFHELIETKLKKLESLLKKEGWDKILIETTQTAIHNGSIVLSIKPDAIILNTRKKEAIILEVKTIAKTKLDNLKLPKDAHERQLVTYYFVLKQKHEFQDYKFWGVIWYFSKVNSFWNKEIWYTEEDLEARVEKIKEALDVLSKAKEFWFLPNDEWIKEYGSKVWHGDCKTCILRDKCLIAKKKEKNII